MTDDNPRPTPVPGSTTAGPTAVTATALPWWRRVAAVLATVLPAVVLLTWGAALRERLPAEIPSHFGVTGAANAWSSTEDYWRVMVIGAVVCLVAGGAALAIRNGYARMITVGLVSFVGSMLAVLWITTALVTLAAPSPQEASLGWSSLVILLVALGYPVLVLMLHGVVRRDAVTPVVVAAQPLPEGHRVAAEATVVSATFGWLAVGVGVVAIATAWIFAAQGQPEYGVTIVIVPGLAAIAVAMYAKVRVTADMRGLRLTSWLGIPIRRIALPEIASVAATHIEPMEWGGWGYRWMPGQSAYVARRGPGLVVTLRSGRRFAVTVDEPGPLAAALAAHLSTGTTETTGKTAMDGRAPSAD